MKVFTDKVAVITGAASGIGRAFAERCVMEGMKIVLADIEEPALAQAERQLCDRGATVLAVRTDVSSSGDVEALAQKALEVFGKVHLLFNNAGVGAGTTIWESSIADWQWVLGVNLWGVINGIRVFVPIMLAEDTECHIVNTASLAGLLPFHPSAAYQVTKHAVVGLSEQLYFTLAQRKAKIKTSVLCPGWVKTRILDSRRNRPIELQNIPLKTGDDAAHQAMSREMETGMQPAQVADITFQAIRSEQFYILTHPEFNAEIQKRMEAILRQQNPVID